MSRPPGTPQHAAPRPPALLAAALAALLAGALACDADRSSPLAPAAPPPPAAAVLEHELSVPFSGVLQSNPCTGETVAMEGALHLLITETTSQGGTVQFLLHQNWEGVTGVGLESGATYRVAFAGNGAEVVRVGVGGQFTLTNTLIMVSRGPAPNFTITYVQQLTFDENGEQTVKFEFLRDECRG